MASPAPPLAEDLHLGDVFCKSPFAVTYTGRRAGVDVLVKVYHVFLEPSNHGIKVDRVEDAERLRYPCAVAQRLEQLRHSNLLPFEVVQLSECGPVAVISPSGCGNLTNHMNTLGRKLSAAEVATHAEDILAGLAQLHAASPPVVHGSLKPENVIVFEKKNGCVSLKLGDAGVARAVAGLTRCDLPFAAPLFWCPPEVLSGADWDTRSDIYCFGALLADIAGADPGDCGGCGDGATGADTYTSPLSRVSSSGGCVCTPPFRSLIAACCAENPGDRPTAAAALTTIATLRVRLQSSPVAVASALRSRGFSESSGCPVITVDALDVITALQNAGLHAAVTPFVAAVGQLEPAVSSYSLETVATLLASCGIPQSAIAKVQNELMMGSRPPSPDVESDAGIGAVTLADRFVSPVTDHTESEWEPERTTAPVISEPEAIRLCDSLVSESGEINTEVLSGLLCAAEMYPDCKALHVRLCQAIAQAAACSSENQKAFLVEGAVECILDIACAQADAGDVVICACEALLYLARGNAEAKTVAVEAGALQLLVSVIQHYSEDHAGVCEDCCNVLSSLVLNSTPHQEELLLLEGLQAILGVMASHRTSESLQAAACLLLRNLTACSLPSLSPDAVSAVIAEVVRALDSHPESPAVAVEACAVLGNVPLGPGESGPALLAAGAVPRLVRALSLGPDPAPFATCALANLACCSREACVVILACPGSLPALTSRLVTCESPDGASIALRVLLELARAAQKHHWQTIHGFTALLGATLHAMDEHVRDPDVQALSASLLALMAQSSRGKLSLRNGGALPRLLRSRTTHLSNPDVQYSTRAALQALGVPTTPAERVARILPLQ